MRKNYECSFANDSKISITFEVNTDNYNFEDFEEILHEFAALSHNTYLALANELNNTL